MKLAAAACLPVLLLAACHDKAKTEDQKLASGQVLPGSISDAMIHYEALKSHPPLAPIEPSAKPAAADQGDGDESDTTPEDAASSAASTETITVPD
jgi:hypothetical protein